MLTVFCLHFQGPCDTHIQKEKKFSPSSQRPGQFFMLSAYSCMMCDWINKKKGRKKVTLREKTSFRVPSSSWSRFSKWKKKCSRYRENNGNDRATTVALHFVCTGMHARNRCSPFITLFYCYFLATSHHIDPIQFPYQMFSRL